MQLYMQICRSLYMAYFAFIHTPHWAGPTLSHALLMSVWHCQNFAGPAWVICCQWISLSTLTLSHWVDHWISAIQVGSSRTVTYQPHRTRTPPLSLSQKATTFKFQITSGYSAVTVTVWQLQSSSTAARDEQRRASVGEPKSLLKVQFEPIPGPFQVTSAAADQRWCRGGNLNLNSAHPALILG